MGTEGTVGHNGGRDRDRGRDRDHSTVSSARDRDRDRSEKKHRAKYGSGINGPNSESRIGKKHKDKDDPRYSNSKKHVLKYTGMPTSTPSSSGNINASAGQSSSGNRDYKRHKVIDTSLLARGMTSRTLGIRIANHIPPLSSSKIEKDLRHMEAYSSACTAYAQQLFAFSNRELVSRGHYGPAPPAPGMTFSEQKSGANAHAGHTPHVTMPIRIDPEEEKRLAILRKRVQNSEAKREVLETEYLSLRAHYVHESHKLRRVRAGVTGQLELLRELAKRRSEVVGLRRVKVAIGKMVLGALLERKGQGNLNGNGNGNGSGSGSESGAKEISISANASAMDVEVDMDSNTSPSNPEKSEKESTITEAEKQTPATVTADLIDQWSLLESKLHEAELKCTDMPTPEDLVYMKNALKADEIALENANNGEWSGGSGLGGKDKDDEVEQDGDKKDDNSSSDTKKNNKRRGSDDGDSAEMAFSGQDAKGDNGAGNGSKKGEEGGEEDHVIPWSCRMMPRTPYGVALYLSNLSSSPELAAAFACDRLFGSAPESLSWLESNLPVSSIPGAQDDSERLAKVRNDVEILTAELKKEVDTNSRLHKEAIEGRKASNEICAMMAMIRSETEAVVQRHNEILEIHDNHMEQLDADADAVSESNDDEDGLVIENGTGIISGNVPGTTNAEMDTPMGPDEDAEAEEGEIEDDLKNVSGSTGPILEVIVPSSSDGGDRIDDHPLGMGSSNKRGYANAEEDPDMKRRKV